MSQQELFDELPVVSRVADALNPPALGAIRGLKYWPEYVSADEEHELTTWVDDQPWLTELERRVQHYGYKLTGINVILAKEVAENEAKLVNGRSKIKLW